MFGNKSVSQKSSWAVQVLTPDYLVDGYFDSEEDKMETAILFKADKDPNIYDTGNVHFLTLTSARLQPISPVNNPINSVVLPKWNMSAMSVFVAIIPRDEASTAYFMKMNPAKHAIAADVYVGPYIIHGTIVSPESDLMELTAYHTFAVRDAEIEHLYSGTPLTGLKMPCLLVNTHLLQGIAQRE